MMSSVEMMMNDNMINASGPLAQHRQVAALFSREQRSARLRRFFAWLTGHSTRLHQLCQRTVNGHYLGARTVAIDQIHGSESRSEDFDFFFHPLNGRSMNRWVSVALARQNGVALPPVELIKVGEEYYVRDGHHRVSVAHAFGEAFIEAEVTEW